MSILSVILYNYETCFHILEEQHDVQMYENKILTKIFGSKRDESLKELMTSHNEEP